MFNAGFSENAIPEGFGTLEIVNGQDRGGAPRRFVALKRTELRGEITGPLATLQLTQIYGYSREECHQPLEAIYRFPLPGNAAVTGVRVVFGEVEIRAALKARRQAESDYGAARREGRQAALVTRESPDVFTLRVTGIQPDQEVRVETSYVEVARPEGGGWSLRAPLTTAPRYARSDEFTSRHGRGQPLGLMRDPGHRFVLDVGLSGAESVTSPTHPLEMAQAGDGVRVRLRAGEVLPDRDFVLSWVPPQAEDRTALKVLLHKDRTSGQVYFLAMVTPPAAHAQGEGKPRETILLVEEALDYGLICSETAFVAERKEAGRRVAGTVMVANALPAGWSAELAVVARFCRAPSAYLSVEEYCEDSLYSVDAELADLPSERLAARFSARSLYEGRDASPLRMEIPADRAVVLFSGMPRFEDGEAVLFESSAGDRLPDSVAFNRLVVRFPKGTPDSGKLDSGLEVLIFVGDLALPRARVRLADLVRRNGERPLNILRQTGQAVRMVLSDPAGSLASGAPEMEVALKW